MLILFANIIFFNSFICIKKILTYVTSLSFLFFFSNTLIYLSHFFSYSFTFPTLIFDSLISPSIRFIHHNTDVIFLSFPTSKVYFLFNNVFRTLILHSLISIDMTFTYQDKNVILLPCYSVFIYLFPFSFFLLSSFISCPLSSSFLH